MIRTSRKKTEIVLIEKNKVNVLAPEDKPDKDIHKIVKSNSKWIFQKQLSLDEKDNTRLTYLHGTKLPYLGKEYVLTILNSSKDVPVKKEFPLFSFKQGKFVARMAHAEPNEIKTIYENWLKKQATKFLEKKVEYYCKLIGLNPLTLKIRVKSQKNRVGSLGRNLVLYFNFNILRLPLNIIDYIVVHELCHIYIPNHSSKYWQLVSSVISDYKERKKWIEKNNQFLIS